MKIIHTLVWKEVGQHLTRLFRNWGPRSCDSLQARDGKNKNSAIHVLRIWLLSTTCSLSPPPPSPPENEIRLLTSAPLFIDRPASWESIVYNTILPVTLAMESFFFFFFFLFGILGPHMWPMEVPRLRVESELHLPAYATATWAPSLHHSPQ